MTIKKHSLSENGSYLEFCQLASDDDSIFKTFRSNKIYQIVTEHFNYNSGKKHLDIIQNDIELISLMDKFKTNDLYGFPPIYTYTLIGDIAPYTLRYIKVLFDIKSYFKNLNNFNICEIGGAYGGQLRILDIYYNLKSYCLVDLPSPLLLAQKYLNKYNNKTTIKYKEMKDLIKQPYDFFISNYAFTELSRELQDIYLDKIILNTPRGYLTYNGGTPEEFNSYTSIQLLNIIPNSVAYPDLPVGASDGKIIIWGSDNQ